MPRGNQSSLLSLMAKTSYLHRTLFLTFLLLALILLYRSQLQHLLPEEKPTTKPQSQEQSKTKESSKQHLVPLRHTDVALVAPKTRNEQVDWMTTFCKDFGCTTHIYTTDEIPEDGFLLPRTLIGHEAPAYLTYIIDNYDKLPPYNIFIHGMEEHWHNDAGGPKTMNTLINLRFEAIEAYGYTNLRCLTIPGCPDSLNPAIIQMTDINYKHVSDEFPNVYAELFNVDPSMAPKHVGHQCCGQFAVTRERIRQRPREDYERILNWIANTTLTDSYGVGWMIEKIWHIVFGMEAQYCPDLQQCRCDLYGWCGPHPSTHNKILTPVYP